MMALGDFTLYKAFAAGLLSGWYPDSIWNKTHSWTNHCALFSLRKNTPSTLYPPNEYATSIRGNVQTFLGSGYQSWVSGWRKEENSDGSFTVYIDPIYVPAYDPSGGPATIDVYWLSLQKWLDAAGGYAGNIYGILGFVDLTSGGVPWDLRSTPINVSFPNGLFKVWVNR